MTTNLRRRLRLALPAALLAAAAHAEEAKEAEPEKITVVGTSIKQTPIDEPYAVDVTSRDNLADQGAPRLTDLIRNLGASHGVVGERSSWYNSSQGGAIMESVANVNLRGLGASRTLVLINGRRQVYVPTRLIGGRFVDINVIPAIALGRMEVLKEGAGAIYGSDAVGGIANFVTRHDFDGFEMSASHDHFDDAGDTLLGGIWGGDVGDSHLVIAAEHGRRQELRARDRSWSLRELQKPHRAAYSGVGNPGQFRFPDLAKPAQELGRAELFEKYTDKSTPKQIDPRCEDLGGLDNQAGNCMFRYQPWDSLIEKTRNTNLFAELNGPLTDRSDYHLEALWSEAVIPGWNATPSYPLFQWNFRGLQEVGKNHPGRQKFCADYGGDDAFAAHCADDSAWYFHGRPFGNSGPTRATRRDTRTWRLAAGITGDFDLGERLLDYDANLSYSNSSANNRLPGIYTQRLFLAYRGYGGPNCGVGVVPEDSVATGMQLGDTGGRMPGEGDCMYYNPFSNAIQYSAQPAINLPGYVAGQLNPDFRPDLANSPELHAWLNETINPNDEAELLVGDITVSGSLWEDVGFALGYMYRRFEARGEPNDLSSLTANPCPVVGDRDCLGEGESISPQERGIYTWTNTFHPYDETHTSHRVFGELALALGEDLDVQLAANYEDAEDNSSLDPKIGLRYRLTDAVSLRGSAQTTFRTPSTDDLNSGAPLTTLEYIASTKVWLQVERVGDESIDPEEAFTFNFGVVVQADDGTELTVDYWSYDFEDVIAGLPSSEIAGLYENTNTRAQVEQYIYCPDGLNTGTCDADEIVALRTPLVNWPGVKTSGIDWHLMRPFQLERGELTLDLSGTYTIEYDIDDLAVGGATLLEGFDAAGKLNFGHALAPPIPDWKGRLSAIWRWGDCTLAGHVNHISSYVDVVKEDGKPDDKRKIDSHTTLDLTFRWQLPDRGLNLAASILNATDEDPPFVNVEHGYDGLTHDGKGRRFKLGLTYSFF